MPNQKDAFSDLADLLEDDDLVSDDSEDSSDDVEDIDGDTVTLGMDDGEDTEEDD